MSFSNFIRLQNFVAHALLCDTELDVINIVTREQLLADESQLPDQTLAAEVLVYITPRQGRDGRTGCGIIVEKPEFRVNNPNLPGPEGDILLTLLILEDPLTNHGPQTGTLKPADQVAQRCLEVLHGYQLEGFGQLFADQAAMQAAQDFEPLRGYRVRLRVRMPRNQADRVAQPTVTEDAGEVTLACATTDARIFYTTDETFPGRSNSGAVEYTEPFTADVGTVIHAAAYKEGQPPSHVLKVTVT